MYNWNMKDNIYMGTPDLSAGKFGKISKKYLDVYINAGTYLIDVKKVKLINMYKKYLKYKNYYKPPLAEQDMINDIAFGKIGYLPIKFGLLPPYFTDKKSYKYHLETIYKRFNLKIIDFFLKIMRNLIFKLLIQLLFINGTENGVMEKD